MQTRTRSIRRATMLCAAAVKLGIAWTVFGSGCSSASPATSATDVDASTSSALTYYADVKPILDAKCVGCHTTGGIAPFPLTTFAQVTEHIAQIVPAVTSRVMPPWPPAQGCTDYNADRSLPQSMIDTISNWSKAGNVEGDPASYQPMNATASGLSRVDRKLKMPVAFTPTVRPDEYRCFLLDWPDATTTYITGMSAVPGAPSMVHHMLVFQATPDQVAQYQAYDDADPAPGYECFGGPYPNADSSDAGVLTPSALPHMLGGWAPGSLGDDFPAGTGLAIAPGSKIILQVHYNTLTSDPVADQSEIDLKLDTSVTKLAAMMPWTNPQWPKAHTMDIAAGDPDAGHSFEYDGVTGAAQIAKLQSGAPFTVYSAALHMHLHGTHTTFSIDRSDGTNECMLDIPRWSFHWQGSYAFTQPKVVAPGDQLKIECHWDNSADNQPLVNNEPTAVADLNWGEGTTDEMCIGFLYVTQ